MSPAVSTILDTRRAITTLPHAGKFPIKLRVTFPTIRQQKKVWIQQHFPLHLYATKKEFDKLSGAPRIAELRAIKARIMEAEARANDILTKNKFITIQKFTQLFSTRLASSSVALLYKNFIEQLTEENRTGTAQAYQQSLSSLLSYGGDDLQLIEINERWLRKYETTMITKGRSRSTIGMYLRCLRAIFNMARDEGIIAHELYPFGRKGYTIPTARKTKNYLDEPTKNKLLSYRTDIPAARKALDLWILSYYCNGMNFSDIALLTRRSIRSDSITFIRKKSARSSSTSTPIVVPMRPEVQQIIARYGSHNLHPDAYVFDIINSNMTALQQKKAISQFIKVTNKYLKRIGRDLGLQFPLTTYIARHTFATIAMRHGASKEFLQNALGHSNILTTDSYLHGFDFATLKAISDKL